MAYRDCLYGENAGQDGVRFSGLKPVNVELTVRQDKAKAISDMLIGVFFEDINYGADGGLYAELVQNRDFEYTKGEGREAGWGPTYAWEVEGDGMSMDIETADPIHQNNRHYASLDVVKPGAALVNSGFDGIVLTKGEKYTVSFFARLSGGKQRHDGRSSAAIKVLDYVTKTEECLLKKSSRSRQANGSSIRRCYVPVNPPTRPYLLWNQ